MKTKIYLQEWYLNAGIVGFMNILQHAGKNFVVKKDNYIEFDIQELNDFHKCYFNYFFDMYNVGKKTNERLDKVFVQIENCLSEECQDKQEKKEIEAKLKTAKKRAKDIIKKQIDKIKKIDESAYEEMKIKHGEIDEIKTAQDTEKLESIKEEIEQNLLKDHINEKLTLNLFKSILSKSYFGQISFLNVVKTGCSYEEQENLMYIDYVSNLIETDYLHEIIDGKYNVQEIEKTIKEKQENSLVKDEIKKIYKNIENKFIKKGKTLEDIQSYLKEDALSTCHMCENDSVNTSDYSEGNFVPLAVSSENMRNFFWNQNAKFPICDMCKLLLFCIPAGVTSISKTVKENVQGTVVYREKEIYSFVNYDTSVEDLIKTNNNFSNISKKDRKGNTTYAQLILNIVEQDKKISRWKLSNISVIEFETEYLAYSRTEYFNINKHISSFFVNYSEKSLNAINDYYLKLELVDHIIKNKDILKIINNKILEDMKKEERYWYKYYLATKARIALQILKKEEDGMANEKIKIANAKAYELFKLGNEIYIKLKAENNVNKLDGYIYKMLNCVKGNRKTEFVDTAMRIIWSNGKDTPMDLVRINEEVEWQDLAHAFIAGLTQEGYTKNVDKDNKNEEEN